MDWNATGLGEKIILLLLIVGFPVGNLVLALVRDWAMEGKTARARAVAERHWKKVPDEMERMVDGKAARMGFWTMVYGLMIWSGYSIYIQGRMPVAPVIILMGTAWLQSIYSAVLRYRSTQGDEEYRPPIWKPVVRALLMSALCAGTIAFVLWWAWNRN